MGVKLSSLFDSNEISSVSLLITGTHKSWTKDMSKLTEILCQPIM